VQSPSGMLPLIRSAQSENDLIGIWRHIAADSPTAASRWLKKIDRRIQSLSIHPFMGEHQPQFSENTRRIIEGSYLIFYDVLPDAVHVLRVFHGARKLDDLFD
jgi:toxin ParE1/3/4